MSRALLVCGALALSAGVHAEPGLAVRLEPGAIVITKDGKTLRLAEPTAASAAILRVPLRSDGSEQGLWVLSSDKSGPIGMLVEIADPPRVLYRAPRDTSTRGVSFTAHRQWLVDVDGDGWNDVLDYTIEHTDAGGGEQGATLQRWDPTTRQFVAADGKLRKHLPRHPSYVRARLDKLFAAARKVGSVQAHAMYDCAGEQIAGKRIGTTLGEATPPWVGNDLFLLGTVKRGKGKEDFLLAHAQMLPQPRIVSTVALGPFGYPPGTCEGRGSETRREPGALVIAWPSSVSSLVEQRVPWNGKALGQPAAPPRQVATCAATKP